MTKITIEISPKEVEALETCTYIADPGYDEPPIEVWLARQAITKIRTALGEECQRYKETQ